MVIYVKNCVSSCDTNAQGDALYNCIFSHLKTSTPVIVNFGEMENVTSSFVNSSFVELASHFGADKVKRLIKIESANRQIANMIKERMAKEFA